MSVITCVEDFRDLARSRVPRAIFDYADRGSYAETTIAANRRDLDAIALRQRVGIDVSDRTTTSTMLGHPVTMPVALAPTGLTGLFHGDGEIHAARAAERVGVPFCLSTMSICSIEDVRAAVTRPFWFQLYVMRDRDFVVSLVERARAAECSALVVTVDLQIQGQRHRDLKNGLSVPPKLTLANLFDVAVRPAWALRVLMGHRRTFGNLAGAARDDSLKTLSAWIAAQFDPTLDWQDVAWLRRLWPGKLIIKGILDAEDARHALRAGADAIVVSNHGGRQLDGAPSSIAVLPEIVSAVGGQTEILFDSGVRSGQDVLKALALGAQGCLLGKATLYALGAMGGAGVERLLDIVRRELDVSMALTGVRSPAEVGQDILRPPQGPAIRIQGRENHETVASWVRGPGAARRA